MEMSVETVYLVGLIVAGSITFLYVLFGGDALEGVAESTGFLSPTLILSFITMLCAGGYVLEAVTPLSGLLVFALALTIALVLSILLNLFILIPISNAEESLAYTEKSLKWRVGKVILSIPEDGFGEVIFESTSGTISKTAVSRDNIPIPDGTKVVVLDVKDGVVYVSPF
ncbi:hypothetical protein [Bacillus fonticola]|uniref:hypothetical protein n=1 Tax=Bacillus fonticola TaxID=2728853 RepID=UPI001472E475|nr:hypothetical protein [Bacillus fonticola]